MKKVIATFIGVVAFILLIPGLILLSLTMLFDD